MCPRSHIRTASRAFRPLPHVQAAVETVGEDGERLKQPGTSPAGSTSQHTGPVEQHQGEGRGSATRRRPGARGRSGCRRPGSAARAPRHRRRARPGRLATGARASGAYRRDELRVPPPALGAGAPQHVGEVVAAAEQAPEPVGTRAPRIRPGRGSQAKTERRATTICSAAASTCAARPSCRPPAAAAAVCRAGRPAAGRGSRARTRPCARPPCTARRPDRAGPSPAVRRRPPSTAPPRCAVPVRPVRRRPGAPGPRRAVGRAADAEAADGAGRRAGPARARRPPGPGTPRRSWAPPSSLASASYARERTGLAAAAGPGEHGERTERQRRRCPARRIAAAP